MMKFLFLILCVVTSPVFAQETQVDSTDSTQIERPTFSMTPT